MGIKGKSRVATCVRATSGHLHAGESVMGGGERLPNETLGQSCGTA